MPTIYVSQAGAGAQDGSSAANARSIAWLNTVDAWNGATGTVCASATKDSVKDTVILCGTITTAFDWPYATSVGTAGLRFLWNVGAKFSAPRWSTAPHYAAFYFESDDYAKNDVEIDFGPDGCIECTDAGTELTYQTASIGLYARSPQRLTITNPRIYNMYVRVSGTEQVQGATGIFVESYGDPVNDLTITGGTIHDTENAIAITGGVGSSNFLVTGVHIYNFNWGISGGISAAGASLANFVCRGNWIHDCECWDQPYGYEEFHHNCIFLYGEPTADPGTFASAIIEGNKLGPNLGTRATAAVYLSHWTMKGTYHVRNNVIAGSPTNGLVTVQTAVGSTTYVHNNSFLVDSPGNAAVVAGGAYGGLGLNVHLRNNAVSGGSYLQINYSGAVNIDSDYNIIHGYTPTFPGPVTSGATSSVAAVAWATWQASGKDAHSIIDQNPLLDSNGRLGAGSPALGAGADLSAFFADDYEGTTRVTPWDMGAYEDAGGGPSLPATNPIRSARFPQRALIRAL